MLLILLLGQGTAPAVGLDVSAVLADLYPQLNATGPGDLVHWTEDELYSYADAAAQRLAAMTPLFVYYDGAVAVTTGWAEIALPARHVATIHVLADIPPPPVFPG